MICEGAAVAGAGCLFFSFVSHNSSDSFFPHRWMSLLSLISYGFDATCTWIHLSCLSCLSFLQVFFKVVEVPRKFSGLCALVGAQSACIRDVATWDLHPQDMIFNISLLPCSNLYGFTVQALINSSSGHLQSIRLGDI